MTVRCFYADLTDAEYEKALKHFDSLIIKNQLVIIHGDIGDVFDEIYAEAGCPRDKLGCSFVVDCGDYDESAIKDIFKEAIGRDLCMGSFVCNQKWKEWTPENEAQF